MKHIQIVIVGLLIHIVRNLVKYLTDKIKFRIDIPIDQELPDDEPGRRNKDIVNLIFSFYEIINFLSLALLSMGTIYIIISSISILFSSCCLAYTQC